MADLVVVLIQVGDGERNPSAIDGDRGLGLCLCEVCRHRQGVCTDAGLLLHEGGFARELGVDLGDGVLFGQCRNRAEEVRAKAQLVAVDLHAHRSERGREVVERRERPLLVRILRGDGGVEVAGVDPAVVVRGDVVAEVPVHRQVIAGDHDGRVVVEVLLLDPVDKLCHLGRGAGHDVCILVAPEGGGAEVADIAVGEVGIHGQHREVEGLIFGGEFCQLLLCKGEELFVLKAPPHLVVAGDPAVVPGIDVVVDCVVPVLREVELSAAEGGIGAAHEDLVVALILQDVAQRGDRGEELGLSDHGVVSEPGLEREPGGCGKNAAHGPGRAVHRVRTVERSLGAGEVLVLLGQARQLGNAVEGKAATVVFIGIGHLHGLQIDVDQVPLLLRERERHVLGIRIVVLDEGGIGVGILQIGGDVEAEPGGEEGGGNADAGENHDPVGDGKRFALLPDKKEDHQHRSDHSGEYAAEQEGSDDAGAGALQGRRQLVDDLLQLQVAPHGEGPAGRGDKEHGKRKEKDGEDLPEPGFGAPYRDRVRGDLFLFRVHCVNSFMKTCKPLLSTMCYFTPQIPV